MEEALDLSSDRILNNDDDDDDVLCKVRNLFLQEVTCFVLNGSKNVMA